MKAKDVISLMMGTKTINKYNVALAIEFFRVIGGGLNGGLTNQEADDLLVLLDMEQPKTLLALLQESVENKDSEPVIDNMFGQSFLSFFYEKGKITQDDYNSLVALL